MKTQVYIIYGTAFIAITLLKLLLLSRNRSGRIDYRNKRFIMTQAELTFYKNLLAACESSFRIMTKVRLADIIEPPKNRHFQAAFNRICSKHIDFVLVKSETGEIVKVIELDDSTHEQEDRKRRDKFVDAAMKSAGVEIVHIKTAKSYNREEIAAIIRKPLQNPPPLEPCLERNP
jgi:very-short-patch-repair endonuclease